ncbi:MAG: radical SAM family heme chaperone HemW [Chitinophagales bacterium]
MAGIYIHVPFCKQACHYCNFYFSTSLGNKHRYLQALLKEIELTSTYLQNEPIETLYFGGGTPSLLQLEEFHAILDKLSLFYNLANLKEFTIEANPDDLTEEKVNELATLKPRGFNRFSIGVQSFFKEDLEYMNRAHTADEALTCIKRVQDAGFQNITIDLIYGTPTMNDERWLQNLETTFKLNIPHISSYALTVEPKTSLHNKIKKQQRLPVNEEQSARQFKILMEQMQQNGYDQYEISNFAKAGHYAIHNTNYWLGKKYLGLGPSAHSFDVNSRRWNIANNINYIQSIEEAYNNRHTKLDSVSHLPYEEETLTEAQKVNERVMTSLRTMWGLPLSALPPSAVTEIQSNLQSISPQYYTLQNNTLTLTQQGKLFADGIAAELFVEEK